MPQGLGLVFQNRVQLELLLKESMVGTGYALAAAVASAFVASRLMRWARRSGLARAGALACSLPGLCGSLVRSLAPIQFFQQPYVHVLYKTPAWLATGLGLF